MIVFQWQWWRHYNHSHAEPSFFIRNGNKSYMFKSCQILIEHRKGMLRFLLCMWQFRRVVQTLPTPPYDRFRKWSYVHSIYIKAVSSQKKDNISIIFFLYKGTGETKAPQSCQLTIFTLHLTRILSQTRKFKLNFGKSSTFHRVIIVITDYTTSADGGGWFQHG